MLCRSICQYYQSSISLMYQDNLYSVVGNIEQLLRINIALNLHPLRCFNCLPPGDTDNYKIRQYCLFFKFGSSVLLHPIDNYKGVRVVLVCMMGEMLSLTIIMIKQLWNITILW